MAGLQALRQRVKDAPAGRWDRPADRPRQKEIAGFIINMVLALGVYILNVGGRVDQRGYGTDKIAAAAENIEAGPAAAVHGQPGMQLHFA